MMEVSKISDSRIDNEFVENILKLIDANPEKLLMLKRFMSIINRRYSNWIMFALHKLKFSAYWELFTLANLRDNLTVQQNMSGLIKAGIVAPIKRNSDDYELILNFWKSIYPHSSRPPAFYRLTPEWSKIAKLLEPILLEKINLDGGIDTAAIEARIEKYNKYHSRALEERRAIQERENNSMGKCAECNNFVPKTAIRGEGYHKYPIGLICGRCDKRSTVDKMTKWIRTKK